MIPQFVRPALVFFAASFGVGLLIDVYAMLNGSVRPGISSRTIRPPIAGLNLPVAGTALTAFGAVGYLLVRYSQIATIPIFIIALAAGGIAWFAATLLMARWALRGPLNDAHEEMEELQGTVATVIDPIGVDRFGRITYSQRGIVVTAPARNINRQPIPPGTEVVIEKLDADGIADVELWSIVEQRL